MAKLPFPTTKTDISLEKYIKTNVRDKRRFRKLGNGAFGTVFGTKSSKTVIKVGYIVDPWGEDVGGNVAYLLFLAAAMKCSTNPFFPKIKSVKVFKHNTSNEVYMIVEMERLKELPSEHSSAVRIVENLVWYKNRAETYGMFGIPKATIKALKEIHNVVQGLRRKGCSTDIHAGNVMIRGKNQLVVTDPVA